MKRLTTGLVLCIFAALTFSATAYSQADYTFRNPSLLSGTALQVNSKYKFPLVKPGVDATITVKAMVGGITLTQIDDSSTGFKEAFQPFINVPPNSNGYVEFEVEFINSANGNPVQQNYVPVTCIDVDGTTYSDGTLYEEDQIQFFPGYHDFQSTGGNLQVTIPSGWVYIKSLLGTSYDGIDTFAKDVMATVMNRNISKFLIRTGARNTSSTKGEVRYRSVYFKTFNYGHPTPLPNRTMISLSGNRKQNHVEIRGALSASHSYDKMIIERGSSAGSFGYIGELDITGVSVAEYSFTYIDNNPENGTNYYRIRLLNTTLKIQEISNTLLVKMDNDQEGFEVINTLMQAGSPVLTVRSSEEEEVAVQVADMSGRIVNQTRIKLYKGTNNLNLSGMHTAKGFYAVAIKGKTKITSQRVLVQ